ncbi:hypothetical protein CRUP_012743 [Coryphaenoides rupestris]|nr:hypothetical protein CRUP_012743 [Coryphaenoides rupestris]
MRSMNLTTAMEFYGYTRFSHLIKESGLLSVLQLPRLQPFLMLWPTDEALQGLPVARQRWLLSPQHNQELHDILEAHIHQSSRMRLLNLELGSNVRSMHGSMIRFDCNKNMVGDVSVNGVRVVERFMTFKEGVAYGIDQLLEPPGLGAHCDGLLNTTVTGRCGSCYFAPLCPYGSRDTGMVKSCPDWPSRSHRPWRTRMSQCRRQCVRPSWTPQCCKNHYGPSCQGGLVTPCGNHGSCEDGRSGRGSCVCSTGFSGTACELCDTGHHGNNCTACECVHGRCDEGLDGSGRCSCETGWYGKLCQNKLEHFEGNGTFCSAMPAWHQPGTSLDQPGPACWHQPGTSLDQPGPACWHQPAGNQPALHQPGSSLAPACWHQPAGTSLLAPACWHQPAGTSLVPAWTSLLAPA